ncbi:MAG: ThiF family adenylyltransferase [Rhodobacteraceae bacterium]|nr:ThiF family adenylyltransferase [Paracoccaceae bacterium]MCY4326895.1 ThiF family adenylyltransferase [Paracoccaceae bacterium]
MEIEIQPTTFWRIRPSVSVIPLEDGVFEFFQSSTRRSLRLRLRSEIAHVIKHLDGKRRICDLCAEHGASATQVLQLIGVLHERCIIEPRPVWKTINESHFYRTLNFLGDYIPATELFAAFERIQAAKIAIVGCGAVGSWVAIQLGHLGFQNFTVVDNDIVEESNLNRSVFLQDDLGAPKVLAIKSALNRISPNILVHKVQKNIKGSGSLFAVFFDICKPDIVVNCADQPSVDLTSEWIDEYCRKEGIPYVIAGGYNLHLSLIGMTVSPGETACFNCSRITLNQLEDKSLRGIRRLWRPKRNLGSLAPLTGITSSLASSEVLRLAVKSKKLLPAMRNRRGEFNFLTNEISFVDIPPKPECGCLIHNS